MIEVSFLRIPPSGVGIIREPGNYEFEHVSFKITPHGGAVDISARGPVNPLDGDKVQRLTTSDWKGPLTLRFFDTAQPSFLPEEVVAELKAKSDPSDPFRPVDARVVGEIVRKHRKSLQR